MVQLKRPKLQRPSGKETRSITQGRPQTFFSAIIWFRYNFTTLNYEYLIMKTDLLSWRTSTRLYRGRHCNNNETIVKLFRNRHSLSLRGKSLNILISGPYDKYCCPCYRLECPKNCPVNCYRLKI